MHMQCNLTGSNPAQNIRTPSEGKFCACDHCGKPLAVLSGSSSFAFSTLCQLLPAHALSPFSSPFPRLSSLSLTFIHWHISVYSISFPFSIQVPYFCWWVLLSFVFPILSLFYSLAEEEGHICTYSIFFKFINFLFYQGRALQKQLL